MTHEKYMIFETLVVREVSLKFLQQGLPTMTELCEGVSRNNTVPNLDLSNFFGKLTVVSNAPALQSEQEICEKVD